MANALRKPLGLVAAALTLSVFNSEALRSQIAEPLRAGAAAGGKAALFEEVSAEQSGLDFLNAIDDDKVWQGDHRLFVEGPIASGIAVGDVDGDGLSDIFLGSKMGKNALYRRVGPFRFEDITGAAGVGGKADAWTTGAAFLDFDADGDLDLYVCYFASPNELYQNDGRGVFTEVSAQYGLDIDDASVHPSVADYDKDGDLDIYLATNRLSSVRNPRGQPDRLLRNDGREGFTDVSLAAGILHLGQAHAAVWWDYNADGWPDIYVANDFDPPDQLYRNNGDGTFTDVIREALPRTPYYSMGADLGDVNNDGHIDFVVADMAGTTHAKRMTAQDVIKRPTEGLPGESVGFPWNALYLNDGTERLDEAAFLAGVARSDWTWAARLADFDLDGWVDFYATNGMLRYFTHSDVLARAASATTLAGRKAAYRNSPRLEESNLAFRNQGGGRFEEVTAAWGLDHVGISLAAALADLDDDGDWDLIVSEYGKRVMLYENRAAGNRIVAQLRGPAGNPRGIGAKLRLEMGDGTAQTRELANGRGVMASDELLAIFGLGEGAQAERLVVEWPDGRRDELLKPERNRRYVFTVEEAERPESQVGTLERREDPMFRSMDVAPWTGFAHQERTFDDFEQQALLARRYSNLAPGVAWGDLTGNGWPDAYVTNGAGASGSFFFQVLPGQFRAMAPPGWSELEDVEELGALFFDADGDGDADMALAAGGNEYEAGDERYRNWLLRNERGGLIPARDAFTGRPSSTGPMAAADFDRDGDLDLATGGRIAPRRWPLGSGLQLLENDGMGRFSPAQLPPSVAGPEVGPISSLLWTDFDDDGWIDLLVAAEWGPVRALRNVAGRLEEATEAVGLAGELGLWNSLVAGDFDGDGDMDVAGGNLGLNTAYQAPMRLLYGETANGRWAALEAYQENGDWYPFRSWFDLVTAFPELRRKVRSFDDFAGRPLEGLFGSAFLDRLDERRLTRLESGLFVNEGGRYRFVPLPDSAQLAPVTGLVAADFDGDGLADLAGLHNSIGPRVGLGRFVGGDGFVALGDRDGVWQALPAVRSGLSVDGDVTALTTADIDGDGHVDLLAGRNRQSPAALRGVPQPGMEAVLLYLQDGIGGPFAAGARVTVSFEAGRNQVAEIAVGSGYLSQSPALVPLRFPASDPPRQIRVRWSDGEEREYSWPGTPGKALWLAPSGFLDKGSVQP